MLLAADYYIEKEDLFIVGEDQKIRLVSLWSVVLLMYKDMFCLKFIVLVLKKQKKTTLAKDKKPYNSEREG